MTDGFLHKSGLLSPALADLARHGWQVSVIDDVIADPPEHVVLEAAQRARAADAEIVLGLGGGSSMDVAKLLAVLLPGAQSLKEMYGIKKVTGTRLPLVQMPTTAGTGSEVTAVSIVTTGETTKMGVVSPQLLRIWRFWTRNSRSVYPRGHGRHRHRRDGARDRSVYVRPFEESDLGHARRESAGVTLAQSAERLSRRQRSRRSRSHAGWRDVRRTSVRQFAGRRRSRPGLPDRRHLSRCTWPLERARALSRHALQCPAASQHYAELADVILPAKASGSDEAKTDALIRHIESLIVDTAIPARCAKSA